MNLLGTLEYEGEEPIQDGQIKDFTAALYGNVTNYDTMKLEVTKFPIVSKK